MGADFHFRTVFFFFWGGRLEKTPAFSKTKTDPSLSEIFNLDDFYKLTLCMLRLVQEFWAKQLVWFKPLRPVIVKDLARAFDIGTAIRAGDDVCPY